MKFVSLLAPLILPLSLIVGMCIGLASRFEWKLDAENIEYLIFTSLFTGVGPIVAAIGIPFMILEYQGKVTRSGPRALVIVFSAIALLFGISLGQGADF